ncbi:MAG: DUF1501 domain-containing protein [Sandaracinus sp.]
MSTRHRPRLPLVPSVPLGRRQLLRGALGMLGAGALASLLRPGHARATDFPPLARRVIYLFMAGAPSQLETFDYKPGLAAMDGTELPASVRNGQRLTGMTSSQGSFPVVASRFPFQQHGQSGTWVCDLFPHTASLVDQLCVVRTMFTDAINHDPAVTLMQTGSMLQGRPSMGAWVHYGLGDATRDLPAFTVLISRAGTSLGQPLSARFWGSGFLPAQHQGVQLRGVGDPVLYLEDGSGRPLSSRERLRDTRAALDDLHAADTADPEIDARIEAFEIAHNMQMSVPSLADTSDEPASTYDLYGDDARTPGTFAANCVLARRLLERGVTFVQLYHRDWDHHSTLQTDFPVLARSVDQAQAALVTDLAQRGLLDDTLVIWGGEFGRTVYGQGAVSADQYGRDHHPRNFAIWMAGGGARPGYVHGTTDDFSYNIVEDGVHVHDFHATVLRLLGFDHTHLTFRSEGRDFRLTDVSGNVLTSLTTL